MELDEIKRQAESLSPDEQKKLLSFLVALDLRRDEAYRSELTRRLDDTNPKAWISLAEAERRLKNGL
jgi:hypothetical protein